MGSRKNFSIKYSILLEPRHQILTMYGASNVSPLFLEKAIYKQFCYFHVSDVRSMIMTYFTKSQMIIINKIFI